MQWGAAIFQAMQLRWHACQRNAENSCPIGWKYLPLGRKLHVDMLALPRGMTEAA